MLVQHRRDSPRNSSRLIANRSASHRPGAFKPAGCAAPRKLGVDPGQVVAGATRAVREIACGWLNSTGPSSRSHSARSTDEKGRSATMTHNYKRNGTTTRGLTPR
jgi:hypothetical protein